MPSMIESYGSMTGPAEANAGDARKPLAQLAGVRSSVEERASVRSRNEGHIRQGMICRDSTLESRKDECSMWGAEYRILDRAIEPQLAGRDPRNIGSLGRSRLGAVAQRLRTPLSLILASLDMLARSLGDEASETQRGAMAIANQSGEEMLQLLNDVAEMERTEEGRKRVDPRSLDLSPLLQSAVNRVTPLADRRGVTLVLRADGVLPRVWADKDLTHQVVTSLLDNAIRLTPHRGEIVVICQARKRDVLVSVRDSEHCAPQGQSGSVYERALRVDQDTRGDLVRNSLGLAFCRLAVKSQHGDIWIESSNRQGVNFSFTLPQWR